MATTINTDIKRVKLVEGASLSALETAINTYITTGVESDERVKSVDVDITTVRDAPQPVSRYTATIEIVGTTTTD